jgi:tRNA(Ile)-lysidine synthase
MLLLKRFTEHIQQQNLFQHKDRLLLAVSGGIDSIVLCELCHQAGFNFEIAHCNFQLRGEESERDEQFVQSIGEKYSVKVFIKKFDTEQYADGHKVSIQVAARELRYEWFSELLEIPGVRYQVSGNSKKVNSISYILTAHHANDNIETLLINFFKGTGIKGLHGILPKQANIIRPLLFAKKEEILSFAKENNLSFVEDSSNITDKYTRNYFRNQLIPSIKKVFPEVEENLLNNIERFREIEILYQEAINLHKKKLIEYKEKEIHIPVLKLLKSEPVKTIIYEIIHEYGFSAHQTEEVMHLLKSESGKYISSVTHKIIKNRKWLIISPNNNLEALHILIHESHKEIEFENGKLKIEKYSNNNYKPNTGNTSVMLDADAITFPLLLRKWKQGDYFYPLGVQNLPAARRGKKKLSKFFIDQKISINDKEKIWLIESDKKIIWIIGLRIDDRFKMTSQTKKILELSFS